MYGWRQQRHLEDVDDDDDDGGGGGGGDGDVFFPTASSRPQIHPPLGTRSYHNIDTYDIIRTHYLLRLDSRQESYMHH